MTRSGDEMILELAASLGFNKTAAKKDEEDKECKKCKCDPCECDKKDKKCKKCKCDPCECDKKEDKKKDKKEATMRVLHGLKKLAEELDEIGADEASHLVDDALKVIVDNLKTE